MTTNARESDMHPDLEWLARNVSKWGSHLGLGSIIKVNNELGSFADYVPTINVNPSGLYRQGKVMFRAYTLSQWQAARQKLGLDSNGIAEPDEEECLQLAYERMGDERVKVSVDELREQKYSAYFKDVRHIDTLDVYRVLSLFDCEKHGHPIGHAAKKLLLSGSRTGGKDVESDVREAIDALNRWLEMREEDARA